MTMQARLLSFGGGVILLLAIMVVMQRIGAAGGSHLIMLGVGAFVTVLAAVLLGRRLTGATSSYPADWTPRHDRRQKLARVGATLVIGVVWTVVAYGIYRGVDVTLGPWLSIVIQALCATTFLLIGLGPTDWSKSRSWQVHLMTIIALTMGLMATASGLARLAG